MRDPYDVLEVSRASTQEEIRAAYKKAATTHHPDKHQDDPEAEQRFKEINAAYEILKDPEKRAAFDRFGPAMRGGMPGAGNPFGGGVTFDVSELNLDGIFGDLLGVLGIKVGGAGTLQRELRVTFEEAAFGCTKDITYERAETCADCTGTGGAPGSKLDPCAGCGGKGRVRVQQGVFPLPVERMCAKCSGMGRIVTDPCKTCRGAGIAAKKRTVEVTIPPGIENGASRIVERGGNVGRPGRPPGELEIVIRVEPHELFRRAGDDVVCALTIPFTTAALGADVAVPTLEGKGRLRIQAGTQPGTVLRIRGKGIPRRVVGGRGDLLVEVQVAVPTQLGPKQRELLEALALESADGAEEELPPAETPGFFDKLKNLFS